MREVTQLLRERFRMRFILCREDDGFAAADQIPRERSTDVADPDDSGCHGDSSFLFGRWMRQSCGMTPELNR